MRGTVKKYERKAIEKILNQISHSQLMKILKEWDPILPIKRKQNKIKTLCFYLNVGEKDEKIPLSNNQYSDLVRWAEYGEFLRVKKWERIHYFKQLNISMFNTENLNECLNSEISKKPEIQSDLKSGRHYRVGTRIKNDEIWIEFAFDLLPQAKEIWIRKWEYISSVSRVRAKINKKGEILISGRNKNKLELLLSTIKKCMKKYKHKAIKDEKDEETFSKDEIKTIIQSLPKGEVLELIRFKVDLPGINEIKVSFSDYNVGIKTLADHFKVNLKDKNMNIIEALTNKRKLNIDKRETILD